MSLSKYFIFGVFVLGLLSCGNKKPVDIRLANFIFEDTGRILSIRNTKTDQLFYAKENTDINYGIEGYKNGEMTVNLEEGYAALLDHDAKTGRYFVLIDNEKQPVPPKGYDVAVHKAFTVGYFQGKIGRTFLSNIPCSCLPNDVNVRCDEGGPESKFARYQAFNTDAGIVCANSFYPCCRNQNPPLTK